MTDISFADGKVGRAFSLEGDNSIIKVSGSETTNVGKGSGMSICAWIKPSDISKDNPIFEWVQDHVTGGTQFHIYPPHGGPGSLYGMFSDTEGTPHYFSAARVLVPNVLQHVALTYDKKTRLEQYFATERQWRSNTLGFSPLK